MQQPACSLKAIDARGFKLERFEAMGLLQKNKGVLHTRHHAWNVVLTE
jgi:hypothetical protein